MKIAITTWHGGPNSGTFFQLFGLYKYLESRGHEVEVINYRQCGKGDFIYRGIMYFLCQPISLLKRRIRRKRMRKEAMIAEAPFQKELALRTKRFDEMYGQMKFTSPCCSDEDFAKLNEKFDAFVVGSDQVWNASMLNRRYLLDYVERGKIKASYCPSMGSGVVMKRQRNAFREYLKDFDYISTREGALRDILQEKLHRPVYHLLDPSMLISREDYLRMAHLPEDLVPNSYLLCYFMPKNDLQLGQVRSYARRKGLKIVIMTMMPYSFTIKDACIYASAGPKEFVGLIANAAIVFTSSFHCTIFSIMLQKDFYVFEQSFTNKIEDTNKQYIEQLDTYRIMHRLIRWGEDIKPENEIAIDYEKVEPIFQKRLEESKAFLNQFA